MLGYLNIKNNASVVLLHEQPQYAESAAFIIAKEWKNNQGVINRNINNMKSKPISNFPCHLGLILNSAEKYKQKNNNSDTNDVIEEDNVQTVVGHAKITKADGRSDGACCIAYSVVVDIPFRGLGLGRYLMEKVEEYIKSLGISYIYLSTPDKVQFYKHLGYKESEAVSTLGGSAKHLSKTQVASLEGLFAKRLDIEPVTPNNVWLRKRLIYEYAITDPQSIKTMATDLSKQLSAVLPPRESNDKIKFSSFVVRLPWQQQVGPSCGVSALTMVYSYLKQNARFFVEKNYKQCNDGLDFVNDKSKICEQCSSEVLTVGTTTTNMAASAIQFCIESGISYDGEMFCSYNLLFLAAKYYKMNLNVSEISDDTYLKIFQSISQGYPVVIPYDRNLSNHKPGQYNGKQAHWAVVNGVIIQKNIDLAEVTYQHELNSMIFSIFESKAGNNIPCVEDRLSSLNKDGCYLICTHGMSSQPFICLYDDMITSNQQLVECKSKFYLTSGNLKHLRNKIVFLI